ncbi:longitudinals lacking protein-like [Pollicipes pollicipes]|uniref:longitudinals lacking protein-like n=1 Tax=Pollicipes pollicipes TaxID=41117 RepID=UPI001884AFDC|nr:longitudinals lacking protein-like [Pollicipes pollicipes]
MGSQLLLRWDNHLPSFACSMKECLDDGDLTDLTISCQGRVLHCHRLVLSVASPHFKQLLKANPGQHPIVIMRDIPYKDIAALLTFHTTREPRRASHLEPEVVVKEEPCDPDEAPAARHPVAMTTINDLSLLQHGFRAGSSFVEVGPARVPPKSE